MTAACRHWRRIVRADFQRDGTALICARCDRQLAWWSNEHTEHQAATLPGWCRP